MRGGRQAAWNGCSLGLCVAFLALGPAARAGTITPLSQERFVEATLEDPIEPSLGIPGGTERAEATDFSDFDESVAFVATASQTSIIRGSRLVGEGAATSSGTVTDQGSDALSSFEVIFSISTVQRYSLTGRISRFFGGGGNANVLVRFGPDGGAPIFEASDPTGPGGFEGSLDIDESGVLQPGSYALLAFASGDSSLAFDSNQARFEVELLVPEPGSGSLAALGLLLLAVLRRRESGL